MIRFLNRYWLVPAVVSVAVETAWFGAAPMLATWLRFADHGSVAARAAHEHLGWHVLAFAGIGVLSLYLNGLYDMSERLHARQLLIRLLRAFSTFVFAVAAVYFLSPHLEPGRLVFAIAVALALPGIAAWRLALRSVLRSERFAERVLIVGSGPMAIELAEEMIARQHLGIRLVGFLSDDPRLQGVSLVNPRVIGTTAQARQLAMQNGVTRVVVAQGDDRGQVDMDALLACKTSGVRVQECSSYYEQLVGKILTEGLRKSWLVFSDGFVVSRATGAGKRAVDLVVATVGLLLASPLLLAVAIGVRLDSPGPVLYRQERVGRRGRPFTLWKFRSMRLDAEVAGTPQWATANDPRVTRFGRFVRRTRLDELPQLCNVLLGDMSLVGPRPERQPFVAQLALLCPYYEQRFVVRPGLTGWAQIMAPYASTFTDSIDKLKLDLYYIKNLSLFLDLSILLSTVRTVLLGRGAR